MIRKPPQEFNHWDHSAWIPWNLSFRYIHCTGQFTPKMKANAEPRLLSSLVWIDSGAVVSQHRLESFSIKQNVTEWQVSWNSWEVNDKLAKGQREAGQPVFVCAEESTWGAWLEGELVQMAVHISLRPDYSAVNRPATQNYLIVPPPQIDAHNYWPLCPLTNGHNSAQ